MRSVLVLLLLMLVVTYCMFILLKVLKVDGARRLITFRQFTCAVPHQVVQDANCMIKSLRTS